MHTPRPDAWPPAGEVDHGHVVLAHDLRRAAGPLVGWQPADESGRAAG